VSRSLIADLARNHLGQIHVQPTFGFEWVSLNVHHAAVRSRGRTSGLQLRPSIGG
jgi:hypothetical protein